MTAGFRFAVAVSVGQGSSETGATVLSDLSANIFAALLIVLILLLQIKMVADRRPDPVRPIEIGGSLPVRTHTALRPGDIIALLQARAPDALRASFDLDEAGLRPAASSAPVAGQDLGDALHSASGSAPVRLYVFSNRWFSNVTTGLAETGRGWIDVSVPRALRAAGNPEAWSPAFLRLLTEHGDDAAFRAGLARLLAATAAPLIRGGRVSAGQGAVPQSTDAVNSASRTVSLRHALWVALAPFALSIGVVVVFFTERISEHPVPRSRPHHKERSA